MKKSIASFALLLLLSIFAWTRELVIAGIPEEPNRWKTAEGKIVGIDVDVIDCIMKKLDIPYRIELVDSSARLEANAKAVPAVYDMIFTYSIVQERLKYFFYAKESHISFNWNFFYL